MRKYEEKSDFCNLATVCLRKMREKMSGAFTRKE